MIKIFKQKISDFSEKEFDMGCLFLEQDKKKRVNSFSRKEDKYRCVAADLLVRNGISSLLGVKMSDIKLGVNSLGKPYAVDLPIEFNISHSGDYAVCVLSDKPVGIDIEQIRPISPKVISRVCCAEEIDFLFHDADVTGGMIENEQILENFFKMWTVKEAYFKCTGEGIRGSFSGYNTLSAEEIAFQEMLDGYVLSVCTLKG